mmetsp:Transcript_49467/g.126001  ORF Transcript_49467/g.126001 Transcript_49467/m.126001 type:complete len:198 (-) Transcript_49467:414-1007(-)
MDTTALLPLEWAAEFAPHAPQHAPLPRQSSAGAEGADASAIGADTPSPPPPPHAGDKFDSESTEEPASWTISNTPSDILPAAAALGPGSYDGGCEDDTGVPLPSDSCGQAAARWTCSVKNSFLHVESDHDETSLESVGAARRSRSAPGLLCRRDGAAAATPAAPEANDDVADEAEPPRVDRRQRRQSTWQLGAASRR